MDFLSRVVFATRFHFAKMFDEAEYFIICTLFR